METTSGCNCNRLSLAKFPGIADYSNRDLIIKSYIKYSKLFGFDCEKADSIKLCCYNRYFIGLNESLKMQSHQIITFQEYKELLQFKML